MQTVDQTYINLLDDEARREVRVKIGLETYTESQIMSLRSDTALNTTVGIGNANVGQYDLVLHTPGTIPRMAKINIELRLNDGQTQSDWMPAGEFFIDTRSYDDEAKTLTIQGFDAMRKADVNYIESAIGEWPRSDTVVVSEICNRMGVVLDSRTVLNKNYQVEAPIGLTMREVLMHIAAAYGGNWCITSAGKLRLVPLAGTGDTAALGKSSTDWTTSPALPAITRVTLWYTEDKAFTAGNDNGYAIEADCAWATQTIANNVLTALSGYVYRPYEAKSSMLDPAAEVGDSVTVELVNYPLMHIVREFDSLSTADIEAPYDEEVDHEFPYVSQTQREMRRTVKLGQSYYGTKITRQEGLVIEKTDGDVVEAKAVMNTDKLSFQVLDNGVMLDKLYFDPVTGQYVFDGKITIRNGSIEFIGGASFTSVRYSTDRTATIPSGWSTTWDAAWDDGETQVWAIYSYNDGADWTDPVLASAVGHDPITVSVYSTSGSVIAQGVDSTRVYAKVYQGSTDLTSTILYSRFVWHKYLKDGTEDLNWQPTYSYDGRRDSINVSQNDISDAATFVCELLDEEPLDEESLEE